MTTKIRCIGPTGSPIQKVKRVSIANVASRLERILSKTKTTNPYGRITKRTAFGQSFYIIAGMSFNLLS